MSTYDDFSIAELGDENIVVCIIDVDGRDQKGGDSETRTRAARR
jgi:hypothetical protein